MVKKIFFLVVALLVGGMTTVNAKINYVPLYIVDTQPDVKKPRHAPAMPLIITQDDHKLTLPEFEDSLVIMVLKGDECLYQEPYQRQQPTVNLPITLIGDYEVRLFAGTYYYYGFITLEMLGSSEIPTENANWDNITLLGSNTAQEVILDDILGLNVVKYNNKGYRLEDQPYVSEELKEWMIQQNEEIRSTLRYGLLPEELSAIFPSLVTYHDNGDFGINYVDLIPILICCIQELKYQLDNRTETIVDIVLSRGADPSAVREVRAAIGSTLLSVAPSSVSEPAQVRFLLGDDASNVHIAVTDMGGRVITSVPVSPSDTSTTIDSGVLGEGIFLCTLFVNGENVATKRLVKTR